MATRWPRNKIDLKITNCIKDMATRWPRNKIDLKITRLVDRRFFVSPINCNQQELIADRRIAVTLIAYIAISQ